MTENKNKRLVMVTSILGMAALVPFVFWTAYAAAPDYAVGHNLGDASTPGITVPLVMTGNRLDFSAAKPVTAAPALAPVSVPVARSSAWPCSSPYPLIFNITPQLLSSVCAGHD